LAKEALQQLSSFIEASAPPWIVVVGLIMVRPTVILSIVGPVIATVGIITIAAILDFLDCGSTKLD
jgi:hypothetical protein